MTISETASPLATLALEGMLRTMALSRAIETVMDTHTRNHPISGWWHPGEGQEGAAAGATAALRREDIVYYQGRGTAWAIGKGMDPAPILGDLLGRTTGSTGGKGGGVPHWADPDLGLPGEGATLGSVYPLAAGAALAAQIRGTEQVVLANFGDGTSSRGTFHETLIQAAVWRLPLIYFCENNEWIVSMRFADQSPTADVADRAAGYGVPAEIVDGQDAIAVHEAVARAAARARSGGGPTLIEAKVVRRQGHYNGDLQQYRDPEELQAYRDPIDVLRSALSPETVTRVLDEAEQQVAADYESALAAPFPDLSILQKDLYA